MKKFCLGLLASAMLLGSGVVSAQEMKPIAVVSFAGYDRLIKNIGELGQIAANKQLAEMAENLLKAVTQGQGLAGVDRTQPWGLVLSTDGTQFPAYAFLPVTDVKKFLEVLKPHVEIEATGASYTLKTAGQTLYLTPKGKWAFLAMNPENLVTVSAEPAALLGDLTQRFVLAARLNVSNVPDSLRELLTAQIRFGMQMSLQQAPQENEEQFAARKQMTERAIEQFVTAVTDLEQITLGAAVDALAKKTYVDVTVTAKAGTKTAERMEQVKPATTRFAGFQVPSSMFAAAWAGKMSQKDIEQSLETIANLRTMLSKGLANAPISAEERKQLEKLLGEVLETVRASTKTGISDGALSVQYTSKGLTLVGGAYVVGGDRLNKILEDSAAMATKRKPELAGHLKLNAETYKGIRFHRLQTPIPANVENRERVVKLLGPQLDIVVGVGAEAVYFGAGRDPLAAVRQAIDRSASAPSKPIPPFEMALALGPVARIVSEIGDENAKPVAAMLAMGLAQSEGKDRLRIVATPIQRGMQVRVELEEGVVKLLGSIPALSGAF